MDDLAGCDELVSLSEKCAGLTDELFAFCLLEVSSRTRQIFMCLLM